ncbi:conserved hypothetical protein [Talaromyces stipitatus ATCC 10500]|uniref:Luciferase-like domain-containing protein n=1 Tax=Talaromyces stipitatus (strain ATCC 10500 / CBS 375.48 / QM 6759 / NRRL 1006) TaxID=441959 RepID=B8MM37_TALSN|nr:uncharacterized protein TSTA_098050 [Talaromyces stipitatus ATCC 10500]EED13549.1 conserved hypothetical protein [Talaromyces stipitatus ATCC 10500]
MEGRQKAAPATEPDRSSSLHEGNGSIDPVKRGYMTAGQWRRSGDTSTQKDTLKYYLDLARLAERGKISAVFLADWYVGSDVYDGSLDTCLNRGQQVEHLDPVPIISAMASVTQSVSFAVTMSATYIAPFVLARQMITLDHLTGGRCAWNIVTNHTKGNTLAFGQDDILPHDERYVMVDEYMDVVYKLWESSWVPNSVVWDREKGIGFNANKIKLIEHRGKYFKVTARNQVHPTTRIPLVLRISRNIRNSVLLAQSSDLMKSCSNSSSSNTGLGSGPRVLGIASCSGRVGAGICRYKGPVKGQPLIVQL